MGGIGDRLCTAAAHAALAAALVGPVPLARAQPEAPPAAARFTPTLQDFPNPERGFYRNIDLTDAAPDAITAAVADGTTLLRAYVRLDDFVARDLSDVFLATLDRGLANVRRSGAKTIVRFTYNFPADLDDPRQTTDAGIDQALRHIRQLAPVLRRNADVIAFLEAGFVGAWGEWHTSRSGLDSPANKVRIRDALLEAMPVDRAVLFRQPADLHRWYPEIGRDGPHPGSPQARSGVHNDCFLSTRNDAGTYPARPPGLRDYVRRLVEHAPFGGETCNFGPSRSSCADILREGREYAVTYLNEEFYRPAFHDRWAREGCLAQVRRSLGYRLVLQSLILASSARAGESVPVRLALSNVGWAPVYASRRLVLHLDGTDGRGAAIAVEGIEPRSWRPAGTEAPPSVSVGRLRVPANLPPGEYRIAIALPDPAPSLAADPRHAIRPANADDPALGQAWDAARGAFRTGLSLTVRKAGP